MTAPQLAQLALLAALWGASFLFMRVSVEAFGPLALMEVRVGVAALCLLPLLFMAERWQTLKQNAGAIILVALTNTAIPFCLFAYGLQYLSAGLGSVLNATAPMFGSLIAFLWLGEAINRWGLLGLLLGFAGVGILSAGTSSAQQDIDWLPVMAILLATALYGLAACITKKYLQYTNAITVAAGSQLVSALVLLPLAVLCWPEVNPSLQHWLPAVVLGVFCTALAYLLYFNLIAEVGASKAITVTYLIPVFGVVWGIVFLNEPLSLQLIAGGSMVLLGVSLSTGLVRH